jgi:hypothetical protein
MVKSRRLRSVRHVARLGEKGNVHRLLVGKPEGTRSLGRSRHRRVDYMKMDLREIDWNGMDWIDLAQDRDRWTLVITVLNCGDVNVVMGKDNHINILDLELVHCFINRNL